MLYLIYTSSLDTGQRALKIGYAGNIHKRQLQYKTSSPFIDFLDTREGSLMDELCFHLYLKKCGYKSYDGTEWFEYDENIKIIFKLGIEDIYQKVWEFRDYIWRSKRDFKKEKLEVFEFLFSKFKKDYNTLSFSERRYYKLFPDKTIPVFNTENLIYNDSLEKEVSDFLDNHFYKTGIFREKMRMYCEFMDSHKEFSQELSDLIYFKIKDERFRKFYSYYGTVGCRAASYEEKPLSLGMSDVTKESELRMAIFHKFKEGDRYLMKNIKLILGDIYRNLRISKTPKATDLGEFFKLTKTLIKNSETGKKENGFRLDPLY